MATTYEPEVLDPEPMESMGGSALSVVEALNRSEIDMQIATAKKFPRSITAFKRQAMELATLDEDTAASMFYALPRGGKKIEGPSVRLAEVVGSCWGNVRYASRVVSTDDQYVTAQGVCFDLEKNISISVEIKRRITGKDGKTFNADMIQVTSNAACSIALRQAIFKVVPFALVKDIYNESKLASIGKAKTMKERRHGAFEWFAKAGATAEEVLALLEKRSMDDVTNDDLISLTGLRTAIKDGETTLEEAFAEYSAQRTKHNGSKAQRSPLADTLVPKTNGHAEQPAGDESAQAPDLQAIHAELRAAQTEKDALAIYDRCCGPQSDLDESDRAQVAAWWEIRRAELKAVKGKAKDKLFETNQNAGN